MATAQVFLGTQGWSYGSWVGSFYPPGTRSQDMLAHYARAFSSVEVDATFYQIPAESAVARWRDSVPEGFVFALKVPQEITHERRLEGGGEVLARFLSRIARLDDHLGPILLQLSPAFRLTEEHRVRFSRFIAQLPRDFRWAVEFRDEAWLTDMTLEVLAVHSVALALVDGRWLRRVRVVELAEWPTAGFGYVRWMGADRRFSDHSRVQSDAAEEFAAWAPALQRLSGRVGRLFGFVNNHFQGHAPHSARAFQRILGQTPVEPSALREQVELF